MHTIEIKNGIIVDGSGSDSYIGNVYLKDKEIIAITHGEVINSDISIDATGKIVTPGFIDLHSHSDFSFLLDSTAQSKLRQGVTMELLGNCGFSLCAPLNKYTKEDFDSWISEYTDTFDITWSDFGGYIAASKKANAIVQDFFSADAYRRTKYADLKPKIITSIAMFYDLDDPQPFVEDIHDILDDDGVWVLQLSYTPLMLKQLAFDNICHEHICYYSLSSLKYVMDRVGFDIVDCQLNDVNGGSFRVYLMKKTANKTKFRNQQERDVANFRVNSILEYEKSLKLNDPQTYIDFYSQICKLREDTMSFIENEKAKGKKIAGYGASTKGNTLLQWYGLNHTHVDYIAERSAYKYGLKTAGTKIPIIAEDDMRADQPDYLLILPWHFINEFAERETEYIEKGGKFIVPCPKFLVYPDEGK